MSIIAAYSNEPSLPDDGRSRAAILLLALGAEGAARLLKHLSPEEIRLVRESAAGLPTVGPEHIDEVVDEFQSYFKKGAALAGPVKAAPCRARNTSRSLIRTAATRRSPTSSR